jgi:hypothetical protein
MSWHDLWFVRFTRFGTTHLVRAQETPDTCGIACIMMICCRVNKWTTVREGMLVEKNVYEKYDVASGQPKGTYNGKGGTDTQVRADVLNSLGIGTWQVDSIPEDKVADAIIESANTFQLSTMPVVLRVVWDGGGMHAVIVDNVINLFGTYYACVNDPVDGDVHVLKIAKGQPIIYEPKDPISVNLWGKPPEKYAGDRGKFAGVITRCKSMDVSARLGKVFLSGNPL